MPNPELICNIRLRQGCQGHLLIPFYYPSIVHTEGLEKIWLNDFELKIIPLINGRNSIADIINIVAQRRGLSRETAEARVRQFLFQLESFGYLKKYF